MHKRPHSLLDYPNLWRPKDLRYNFSTLQQRCLHNPLYQWAQENVRPCLKTIPSNRHFWWWTGLTLTFPKQLSLETTTAFWHWPRSRPFPFCMWFLVSALVVNIVQVQHLDFDLCTNVDLSCTFFLVSAPFWPFLHVIFSCFFCIWPYFCLMFLPTFSRPFWPWPLCTNPSCQHFMMTSACISSYSWWPWPCI